LVEYSDKIKGICLGDGDLRNLTDCWAVDVYDCRGRTLAIVPMSGWFYFEASDNSRKLSMNDTQESIVLRDGIAHSFRLYNVNDPEVWIDGHIGLAGDMTKEMALDRLEVSEGKSFWLDTFTIWMN